jgi:hypothetical protein
MGVDGFIKIVAFLSQLIQSRLKTRDLVCESCCLLAWVLYNIEDAFALGIRRYDICVENVVERGVHGGEMERGP